MQDTRLIITTAVGTVLSLLITDITRYVTFMQPKHRYRDQAKHHSRTEWHPSNQPLPEWHRCDIAAHDLCSNWHQCDVGDHVPEKLSLRGYRFPSSSSYAFLSREQTCAFPDTPIMTSPLPNLSEERSPNSLACYAWIRYDRSEAVLTS